MFFIAYDFKRTSACVCRTSENCKSLVLQDKCNIEIFLSSDLACVFIEDLDHPAHPHSLISESLIGTL